MPENYSEDSDADSETPGILERDDELLQSIDQYFAAISCFIDTPNYDNRVLVAEAKEDLLDDFLAMFDKIDEFEPASDTEKIQLCTGVHNATIQDLIIRFQEVSGETLPTSEWSLTDKETLIQSAHEQDMDLVEMIATVFHGSLEQYIEEIIEPVLEQDLYGQPDGTRKHLLDIAKIAAGVTIGTLFANYISKKTIS